MRKLIVIGLVLAGMNGILYAQQAPQYSQYMLNGFLLNPAVAGSEGYTAVNLTAREQWIGFLDAPSTYALSFQTRLLRKSPISRRNTVKRKSRKGYIGGNVGLGGYIFNHQNGAVNRTGLKFTYAYHLEFEESQLSFGLSVMGFQYRIDEDRIELENPDDRLWLGMRQSVFIPDADAGIYYSAEHLYGGFSVGQLLESTLKFGDTGFDRLVLERDYHMMAGYDFQTSNQRIILSPSTHVKIAENGKAQADLSGRFIYDQSYWGGITYRTGHSIIILAGVSVDRLVFGYAFDIGLNSIMKHSFGTHEFTFIAKFGDHTQRLRWLTRY